MVGCRRFFWPCEDLAMPGWCVLVPMRLVTLQPDAIAPGLHFRLMTISPGDYSTM
jgi:hypothetical protein